MLEILPFIVLIALLAIALEPLFKQFGGCKKHTRPTAINWISLVTAAIVMPIIARFTNLPWGTMWVIGTWYLAIAILGVAFGLAIYRQVAFDND